ncbi:transcription termination/antitermination protein NusG [Coxiella endosymbiont of Amblyomma americanum]|uniref:transcription termination/antitermination protein NusG n=1 Tax=Coxiella endosymbiont of Amblyomma americanum TaxID=325775 RepID=UPI00057F4623|nr:transcription termination/antitermination protein NusG [Coxiella endosymbiont of Amblyomma americanum]AJC50411.1 antitermination protein NusG [Coxiella endosymbiont of Amblyomma americanum]AUJ58752.1 transcription termination/antitermination protein NusG [Coxiella-like endosymbiont of Amblyomma americanum]
MTEWKKRWYILHTYSNHEHYVVKVLNERIQREGLENYFGEIVIPTEEVIEMRAGRKRKSQRKFFPGYILVRMIMNDKTLLLVRNVPKVLRFIGTERPALISDEEVEKILKRVEEGETKPRPKILFESGEVIRIIAGPFADFNGVVEDVNYEKSRLRVSVSIFGRSTPVELEFGQVAKG